MKIFSIIRVLKGVTYEKIIIIICFLDIVYQFTTSLWPLYNISFLIINSYSKNDIAKIIKTLYDSTARTVGDNLANGKFDPTKINQITWKEIAKNYLKAKKGS